MNLPWCTGVWSAAAGGAGPKPADAPPNEPTAIAVHGYQYVRLCCYLYCNTAEMM